MALSLSRVFSKLVASSIVEREEESPQVQWTLPQLSPQQIYKHKSLFGLQASTLFIDKTSVVKVI